MHEEGANYHKPVKVSNIWSNNYIENESNGDRNKALSVEQYLNKISPYLEVIINNLKKFGHMENSVNNSKWLYFLQG